MASAMRQLRTLSHFKEFWKAACRLENPRLKDPESRGCKSKFEERTQRWSAKAASVLGCSGAALWISAELGCEEGLGSTLSASNQASTETNASSLADAELNGSKLAKAKSNVHTARWRIFTDRARDLFIQGLYDEAEQYFFRALEEAREGFGDEDPHVASCYNNMAELYRVKKQYDKAESFYLEAVERLKRSLGGEHESVGFALHNLAGLYLKQKRLDLSQKCYEDALKIKANVLGSEHPEYANTMFHLGEVIRLQGNSNDSLALLRDSIRILEEAGLGHTRLAVKRMNRLSEIHMFSSQLDEAEAIQRKIVQIVEVSKDFGPLDLVNAMDCLALTLQRQGKMNECEEFLERCIAILKTIYGANHIRVAVSLSKLGGIVFQHGKNVSSKNRVLALEKYKKAQGSLLEAIRIVESQWKDIYAKKVTPDPTQQKTAVSQYPLLLAQAWIIIGVICTQELSYVTNVEYLKKREKDGEEALHHALNLLEDEYVQQVLQSSSEAKKLHRDCLQHLVELQSKKKVYSMQEGHASHSHV